MCGCSGSQPGVGANPNTGLGDIYWTGPKAPEKPVQEPAVKTSDAPKQ